MPQSVNIDDLDFEALHAAIIKHVNHNYVIREKELEEIVCDVLGYNMWDSDDTLYKVITIAEGIGILTKIQSASYNIGYKVRGFYDVNSSDRE